MSKDYFIDEKEDNQSYQKTVALCVFAASLVVLIFLVILYMNSKEKAEKAKREAVVEEETVQDDFLADSHNFTSDELDFWKDSDTQSVSSGNNTESEESQTSPYKPDVSGETPENGGAVTATDGGNSDESSKNDDSGEGSLNKDADKDPADDGNHISIKDDDGKVKYYEIMADVGKNEYNQTESLSDKDGILKYKDSKWESVFGIDLSKYNGDIDWKKVKESGVSFAMLRLGSRGYGSGLIELDEKFVEYAQNAHLNGIEIGAYFYSQAINEVEAVEEANYIVGAVGSFGLKLPIAIDVEKVRNDSARADKLSLRDRTALVKKFCETVAGYGYKPIIYADMEMLIAGLDLNELKDYDIWLADTNNPTDFPYNFSMWQYSNKGKIDGITGDVDLNISFIDYAGR